MPKNDSTSTGFRQASRGDSVVAALIAALGLGVVALGMLSPLGDTLPEPSPAVPAFDPSRFILNALLVPALDDEAVPLRWVDPRPVLRCGPRTSVLVDGRPLRQGELVPVMPFELEWRADSCRPFGASGPRLDGGVRLTVYREDWGFSAMVEPAGLRFTRPDGARIALKRGSAVMPQLVEAPPERAMFLL